jgi:hypothetical protein
VPGSTPFGDTGQSAVYADAEEAVQETFLRSPDTFRRRKRRGASVRSPSRHRDPVASSIRPRMLTPRVVDGDRGRRSALSQACRFGGDRGRGAASIVESDLPMLPSASEDTCFAGPFPMAGSGFELATFGLKGRLARYKAWLWQAISG